MKMTKKFEEGREDSPEGRDTTSSFPAAPLLSLFILDKATRRPGTRCPRIPEG